MLMTTTMPTPFVSAYQDSRDYQFGSGVARILGDGDDTGGHFDLIHMTHQRGDATPLHIHHTHDEAFFVLNGEVRGVCGDTEWAATGGGFIWLPRGVPHALQAVSELPLEVLVMSIPGGFAAFVADAGTPYVEGMDTATLAFDLIQLGTIAARHGIEFVGPPVDFLNRA